MGVTYTSSRDRDRRRGRLGGLTLGAAPDQIGVIATALVSILIIGLCYAGRIRAFDIVEAQRADRTVVNLSGVSSADQLDAAMALAFDNAADRRFAARELLAALNAQTPRLQLANVGALARIDVPVAAIGGTRGLVTYARRVQDARERATLARAEPPKTIALFTAGDITAMKPALMVRSRLEHRRAVLWSALGLLAGFQLVSLVWRLRGVAGDRLLLAAAHLLTTLGFVVMLTRPDPLRDALLVVRYTEAVIVALAVCLGLSLLRLRTAAFLRLSYLSLAAAVVLSIALMVLGSGPGSSGAKVNLGPIQPIEAIRLLVVLFLAGYLGRRWELVRHLDETSLRGRAVPAWLNLPRMDHILPVFGAVGISLVLFFTLRDLGPALLLSLIFLSMLAVARARIGMVAIGLAVLAGGFYAGYWLGISRTLTARVAMWRSPWENAVRGGDQVAQAMWAMANGAVGGTGLGLGDTRYLPAGHTDLVLAAIGEELGAIGILVVVAACALIAWRGLRIARAASSDTGFFLALAMTLSLVVPMLVMAAGMLGIVPLTGVVTPFLSYGGSAMVANFAALGLLVAVRSDTEARIDAAPFEAPLRWLGRALAGCAVALLVIWGRVQIVSADQFLTRPQLGLQADGGLRYQFNPRLLEAARTLPRGTVFDRREVPLAAESRVARAAETELAAMHVSLRDACPDPAERCYPLGAKAFHLLGDVTTGANWAASNSSYVERDAEDQLRGFDDRATAVRSEDDKGHATVAVRRDYHDLIPLVRHRWEPDHPAVQALRKRSRDVHVSLDARLQMQVASIVARSVAASGVRKAAVVVLDATTGEVLASVSYPWPIAEAGGSVENPDALLDRARYGLYPPGSTFKLVTAAAALRQDPALSGLSFTCSRLPDGRVGARMPGWGRPVRDDVLDTHPHGTLTMHGGLVQSCNAYFAQLAVRVGADALASAAGAAGIVFPINGPPERLRENLPRAGYGQGDVLATPLRMARVAAAIGSGGMIREPSFVRDSTPDEPKPFLSTESSRLLADYMRDVVTDGTGRLLRSHPVRIAGKTGTAEVDDAASHAWFVGFAPYGPATRRIAFAVLLENAGYGGASAAAVAGQVVTAAASLGMVR